MFVRLRRLKQGLLAVVGIIAAVTLLVFLPIHPKGNPQAKLGFTFSVHAARYLGIDPDRALSAAVQDFKPELVRIPVYWDLVSPKQGEYDWSIIDRQLDILQKGGAKAMLAIGHKLPRWPECHTPAWAKELSPDEGRAAVLNYLTAVVDQYRDNPVLEIWQVENEALFPFGECPAWAADRGFLNEEIALVRERDAKTPIYTTDSGELSLWWRTSTLPVDGIAISLYRAVYNKRVIRWRVNPLFYSLRRALIQPFTPGFMISELELEPWGPHPVDKLTEQEIAASFTSAELPERIQFARETGAQTILAWGVEWWYYRVMNNDDPSYWETAKRVFRN